MPCCGGAQAVAVDKKLELLQTASPFGVYFETHELEKLASIFTVQRFQAGQDVTESPFYLVSSGEIEVISKQEATLLCVKTTGAFFSRHAGVIYGPAGNRSSRITRKSSFFARRPRGERRSGSPQMTDRETEKEVQPERASSFTAAYSLHSFRRTRKALEEATTRLRSKTASEVVLVPAKKIDEFFEACEAHTVTVNQMMTASLEHQLSEVPFIKAARLTAKRIRALGEMCSYKALQPGANVFSQGDTAEDFFILLQGNVAVTIDMVRLRGTANPPGGKPDIITFHSRQAGDSFGVSALVFGSTKRKYTATAQDKCLLLAINKVHFAGFIQLAPSLKETLLHSIKRSLLQRHAKINVPFISSLTPDEIEQAATLSHLVNVSVNDVIVRQGELCSSFYLVLEGSLLIETVSEPDSETSYKDHGADNALLSKLLASDRSHKLEPGQYFGELGVLLPKTPSIATATATSKTVLLAIEADYFAQTFSSDRELFSETFIKLLRFDCPLKVALVHGRCRELFTAHLKKEYAHESLACYDELRPLLAGEAELTVARASSICQEFLVDNAPQQVNVSQQIQKAVQKAVDGGDLECIRLALEKTQKEVYDLMSRDSWHRFVRSPDYLALLEGIGSYGFSTNAMIAEMDIEEASRFLQVARTSSATLST